MSAEIIILVPNYSWFGKRPWNTLPFAIPILSSCLKKYDHEIIDTNINNYSERKVYEILREKTAKIVLISTISYDYFKTYHKLAEIVKLALPSCFLILGGVYVTTCIDYVMQDLNIDIGMMGHAEDRLDRLVEMVIQKNFDAFDETEGIAYRKNGKLCINQLKSNVADATMVKPDYSKTPIMQYINKTDAVATNFVNESKARFANVLTSYGCPYNCLFCASRSISGRKVVVRPAEDVLEEIDFLVRECNIKLLNIMDDNILFDRKRAEYIFNEIIEREYGIEIRIDNLAIWHLDKEIIGLLKRAGVTRLGVSVESGCERVLHQIIRKPLKLEIVKPTRELLRENDILVNANFIIGFPGETWDEIRENLAFAEYCDFDYISIHLATPLPKTDLLEYAKEQGALPKDFSFFKEVMVLTGSGQITTDEFTPGELEILRAYE